MKPNSGVTTEIPLEIAEAARLIENWMKENGSERWELLGICSRNHAEVARKLARYADHSDSCPQNMFLSDACDCGLKKLLDALPQ